MSNESNNKKTKKIIIFVVLGILILGLIGYFVLNKEENLSHNKDEDSQKDNYDLSDLVGVYKAESNSCSDTENQNIFPTLIIKLDNEFSYRNDCENNNFDYYINGYFEILKDGLITFDFEEQFLDYDKKTDGQILNDNIIKLFDLEFTKDNTIITRVKLNELKNKFTEHSNLLSKFSTYYEISSLEFSSSAEIDIDFWDMFIIVTKIYGIETIEETPDGYYFYNANEVDNAAIELFNLQKSKGIFQEAEYISYDEEKNQYSIGEYSIMFASEFVITNASKENNFITLEIDEYYDYYYFHIEFSLYKNLGTYEVKFKELTNGKHQFVSVKSKK